MPCLMVYFRIEKSNLVPRPALTAGAGYPPKLYHRLTIEERRRMEAA
jgi:hypothetical protein